MKHHHHPQASFDHILPGYFTDNRAIVPVPLPKWQWINPGVMGDTLHKPTAPFWYNDKHSKAKQCVFSGICRIVSKLDHDDVTKWNIFRDTRPLCGELTGQRWISLTQGSDAELWCFSDLCLNKRLSKQSKRRWFETASRTLWCHCNVIKLFVSNPWYHC